jgi:hypothetical protein
MRCSSIPSSLILVATAALTFGACGAEQTQPGGAGATPPASTMPAAGSGTAAGAGTSGGTSTAGRTGATTSPATGAAAGGTATGTTTGSATGAAGSSTGAAGSSTGAATGSAGAATGSAGAKASGGAAGAAGATGAAAGGGAAGGAAAGGAVTFTKVHEEVLTGAGCAVGSCHGNASGSSKLGFADKADAYMGLVGIKAMGMGGPGSTTGGCMGMPIDRVKAGDPAMSLLVQKLENKQTCGQQMPPGSSISPDKIQLVKDWIMAGAKND